MLWTAAMDLQGQLLAVTTPEVWHSLLEILLLLGLAMILGTLAERLHQSPIVGYLIAGTIIGPSVLGLVSNQEDIFNIAEVGVALLLFAIGLEFSPKRLMSLGKTPLVAGLLQVTFTLIVSMLVSWLAGMDVPAALVIGSMVALSSTACVVRILSDRAELDTPYGKLTLGILLIQDIAVVPLMLMVTILTMGATVTVAFWQLATAIVSASLLIVVSYGFFTYVAPMLLTLKTWRRNRDLPILLAVVMAMGSAWAAHRLGLSPAMGAFVAGVLLAVSPFAVQIRADIEPLKTVLLTLFFAAVGMFGDVGWLLQHFGLVCAIALAIVLGKGILVAVVARLSGARTQFAIASAFCLAQVGEFSFVLATIAHGGGAEHVTLPETVFRAIISATMLSLLTTPYLIAIAPHAGVKIERCLHRLLRRRATGIAACGSEIVDQANGQLARRDLIFVIGFGPAGQRAAEDLLASHQQQLVILDINAGNIEIAQRYGLAAYIGDATQSGILEHAGIDRANLVIITVPSPLTSRQLVHLVRFHATHAIIFARARYHVHHWQLVHAGAHVVVDEEDRVGHELAAQVMATLDETAVD